MGTETRLKQLQRKLDERAPVEPLVVQIVWYDEATGEEELAGEVIMAGGARRAFQLRWPEDKNDEKRRARTRQDARSS